eukprot:16430691-Heterocapsa_arctica.AAC.1
MEVRQQKKLVQAAAFRGHEHEMVLPKTHPKHFGKGNALADAIFKLLGDFTAMPAPAPKVSTPAPTNKGRGKSPNKRSRSAPVPKPVYVPATRPKGINADGPEGTTDNAPKARPGNIVPIPK